jgi:hypothetical protein
LGVSKPGSNPRQQFGSTDEVLSKVWKILDEISVGTLEVVFGEWINRFDGTDALQQTENTWNEASNGPLM